MTNLKTLKDIFNTPIGKIRFEYPNRDWSSEKILYQDILSQEAINDLINIYKLEKILKIKLNNKTCGILTKYIMWKFDIKENDKKLY